MSGPATSLYRPLPGPTFIRVVILASGESDDDVFCWLKLANLDRDHDLPGSTAPRPLEGSTFETIKTSTGAESTFELPMDVYYLKASNGQMLDIPRHPFQRYTALSYVWGNTADPGYIFLNGRNRVPVTRNLLESLKTLRLPRKGRRLWIDALCINQQDHIEKESQVRLMRRIYQQADSVLAFVPVSEQDQENLQDLIPRIEDAGARYEEARQSRDDAIAERKTANEEEPEKTEGLLSLSDLKVHILEIDEESNTKLDELAKLQTVDMEDRHPGARNIFLEDFDLPLANDPLWASWRRFFASPYFGRIWILQEFALAKRLDLCIGDVTCEADLFILTARYIKMYSGAMNAQYIGHRHPGDPDYLTAAAVRGMHAFYHMGMQRILTQHGNVKERLLDLLPRIARNFQATDPRDKIYGLLGLVGDGDIYEEHVNYSSEETYLDTYIRFAKLFVEGGHGLELICNAGLQAHKSDLPSWVPDWTNIEAFHDSRVVEKVSGSTAMAVINRTLVTTGANVDEVYATGTQFSSSRTLSDFLEGFNSSCQKLYQWLEGSEFSKNPFEVIFHAIIGDDLSQSDINARAHLRKGFKSFMNFVRMVFENIDILKEGKTVATQSEHPQEHRSFLDLAQRATINKKLCMTKNGFFGFIPNVAEIGDHVISFDGCPIAFLARPSVQLDAEVKEKLTYQLIGPAYFCRSEDSRIVTPVLAHGQEGIVLI